MNNHAARVERLAQVMPADLTQLPTHAELDAVQEKMEADPNYEPPWSKQLVQSWIVQLEREVEEAKRAP